MRSDGIELISRMNEDRAGVPLEARQENVRASFDAVSQFLPEMRQILARRLWALFSEANRRSLRERFLRGGKRGSVARRKRLRICRLGDSGVEPESEAACAITSSGCEVSESRPRSRAASREGRQQGDPALSNLPTRYIAQLTRQLHGRALEGTMTERLVNRIELVLAPHRETDNHVLGRHFHAQPNQRTAHERRRPSMGRSLVYHAARLRPHSFVRPRLQDP